MGKKQYFIPILPFIGSLAARTITRQRLDEIVNYYSADSFSVSSL